LARAILKFQHSAAIAFIIALVVLFSPLSMAWSRMFLTESLAVATTMCVFAEILISFHIGRLRWFQIGMWWSAAIFVRYDSVLLVAPIAVSLFYLHGLSRAFRPAILLTLLVALPLVTWAVRSATIGLGFLPNALVSANEGSSTYGYFAWGATWAIDQYDRPSWAFPVHARNYSGIRPPERAFANTLEKERIGALLERLAKSDGQPMPVDIDRAFKDQAKNNIMDRPFETLLFVPLSRAANMWFSPFYSHAWPVELNAGMPGGKMSDVADRMVQLIMNNPGKVLVKALVGSYRYLLTVLFALATYHAIRHRRTHPMMLRMILMVLSFVLLRTLFFSATHANETRYLTQIYPLMEVAVLLFFGTRTAGVDRDASPPKIAC